MTDDFINPKELLTLIKKKEKSESEGKLKIFLGMVAGVGKTYAMLSEAHRLRNEGTDVVIGLVEPHERVDTINLAHGLPAIALKQMEYKGVTMSEVDIDAILEKCPKVVLIDELAHTNVPGSRHTKRYLDILEILKNGIDVYTCLNIQHLESLNSIIKEITGLYVQETVPDSFLERANEIVIIDLPPDELLKRLKEGKIYPSGNIDSALRNFFREGNLAALREIALRFLAEKVDKELRDYKILNNIPKVWKIGNRLMVGIFASPYSETLIRSTKRMADALGTSWIGVYVDNGRLMSEEEKKLLENNLNSVSAMGGELVTTKDEDVINGLIRVARQNQVTQIVVGKTKKTWKNFLYKKTLTDRLFDESSEIDILVVASEAGDRRRKAVIPRKALGIKPIHILSGTTVLGLSTLLSLALAPLIGYKAVGLLFLLIITLSAIRLNFAVLIVMAIASGFIWDYAFIPPRFTFYINAPEDWIMLVAFLITAIVTGTLTRKLKNKQIILESRERLTSELYHFTKDIASARDINSMNKAALSRISSTFNTCVAVFLKQDNVSDDLVLHESCTADYNQKDLSIAKWVFKNEKPAGAFTDTLPSSSLYFTPLKTASETVGVLALDLKNHSSFTYEEKLLLDNFSGQLALGIIRENMSKALNQARLYEESNKIYNTLMDSVSHELKTPLAVIHGSATALKQEEILTDKNAVSNLVDEIIAGSDRMQNLVQNLLDMNRLEADKIQLKKEPVIISELIMMVVNRLEARLKDKNLEINIEENIPPAYLDFVLMEQAIRNIVDNACVHTGNNTDIKISAGIYGDNLLEIRIEDNGSGLPQENAEKVFEKFYRAKTNITGGTGLGLTISKAIIELHGGKITASNKGKNGGAQFIINLPLQKN
jgi:two-component system, OmpR family, sensor histidine kinase KdpD